MLRLYVRDSVDAAPLVHKIWSHTQNHSLQVTHGRFVAECVCPSGILIRVVTNVIHDLFHLTIDDIVVLFQIVQLREDSPSLFETTTAAQPWCGESADVSIASS